jgi:hypothetical protein
VNEEVLVHWGLLRPKEEEEEWHEDKHFWSKHLTL